MVDTEGASAPSRVATAGAPRTGLAHALTPNGLTDRRHRLSEGASSHRRAHAFITPGDLAVIARACRGASPPGHAGRP